MRWRNLVNKTKAIEILEKYKAISKLFANYNDEKIINELISFVQDEQHFLHKNQKDKASQTHGEKEFFDIISSEKILDLINSVAKSKRINNQDDLSSYWYSLDTKAQEAFSIFELNIILFFFTQEHKYRKKDKRSIINLISTFAKAKRMDASYKNLKV